MLCCVCYAVSCALFPNVHVRVQASFHVGGTPMDVQAALGAGVRALGVATGVYSSTDLRDAAGISGSPSSVVLENLSDTAAVLKAFNLS
jgi:phosphoglycolate phosphatase-like HAD superfamily hydrolase